MNSATINILELIFWYTYVHIWGVYTGITEVLGMYMFNYSKYCQTLFLGDYTD